MAKKKKMGLDEVFHELADIKKVLVKLENDVSLQNGRVRNNEIEIALLKKEKEITQKLSSIFEEKIQKVNQEKKDLKKGIEGWGRKKFLVYLTVGGTAFMAFMLYIFKLWIEYLMGMR